MRLVCPCGVVLLDLGPGTCFEGASKIRCTTCHVVTEVPEAFRGRQPGSGGAMYVSGAIVMDDESAGIRIESGSNRRAP